MIARWSRVLVLAGIGLLSVLLPDLVNADDAKTPIAVIRPFDQPVLAGFTTWLKKTGRGDPEHVFRLDNGVLRCGDEDLGYVATREAYKNFHLSVEYRWGTQESQ